MIYKYFILDVDGVFTDGKFVYSSDGKINKIFGDADNDALSLLKDRMHIEMVTGDKRGFHISKKRIQDDMGFNLSLVSTHERIEWIRQRFDLNKTIYMGDGIFDPIVFKEVGYSIAPSNAFFSTKPHANYITNNKGGEGAVGEAVLHILEKIFNDPFDVFNLDQSKSYGNW